MSEEDPVEKAVRLHGLALGALDEGQLDRAEACARDSLELFERESGPIHPDVANVLNCLAAIHERRSQYQQAEAYSRRSVEVMRRVREEAQDRDIDRLFVQSLIALGNAVRTLGRYDDAERHLREAIGIAAAALGDEDADHVSALNSLAMVLKYSGRFDEAAALYDRAFRIAERLNGAIISRSRPSFTTWAGSSTRVGSTLAASRTRADPSNSGSARSALIIPGLLQTSPLSPRSWTPRGATPRRRKCTAASSRSSSASMDRSTTRSPST